MQDFIKKLKSVVSVAVLASLLIHFSLVIMLYISPAKKEAPKPTQIEFVVAPPNARPPVAAKDEQKEKSKKTKKIEKQIVQQEKAMNNEKPDDTRFLSKFNQRVVKQTVAQKSGVFKNTSDNRNKLKGKRTSRRIIKKSSAKKIANGTLPSLRDLKPKMNLAESLGEGGNDNKKGNGEQSQTNDYLKDLDKGPQTLLSSREFKYYAYYQRIRSKLHAFWEPAIRRKVQKVLKSGRTVASANDRITKVVIVLNEVGNLMNVQVVGESGVRDLDEAAIEAFRSAEPFPNPPGGIVENDGKVRIRWDFVLET